MEEFDRDHYMSLKGGRYAYLEPFVNESLSGGGTVASCCREYGFNQISYWRWLREDRTRYERYEDALRHGAEPMADQFRELIVALGMTNDPVKISRIRSQADLLWRYISRISPRMYSEKVRPGSLGGDDPLELLTDDQKVRMAQAFLKSRGVLTYDAK